MVYLGAIIIFYSLTYIIISYVVRKDFTKRKFKNQIEQNYWRNKIFRFGDSQKGVFQYLLKFIFKWKYLILVFWICLKINYEIDYHFHLLRHSCFTNLTEHNVDIRTIQKLAGHSSSKTTEIYCQVSKKTLKNLPLAL